jgi:hypothetical protein
VGEVSSTWSKKKPGEPGSRAERVARPDGIDLARAGLAGHKTETYRTEINASFV